MMNKYALLAYISFFLANTIPVFAMDQGANKGTAANIQGLPVSSEHNGASDEIIRCSICLEDINRSATAENAHITIKCNHTFHINCLNEHVQTNARQAINGKWSSSCPLCNAEITELEPDPEAAQRMQEVAKLQLEAADEEEARRLQQENGAGAGPGDVFVDGVPVSDEELLRNLLAEEQLARQQARRGRSNPGNCRGPNNWWSSRNAFITYGLFLLGAVWTYNQLSKKQRKSN